MQPSRRQLLFAGLAAAAVGRVSRAQAGGSKPKNLILVFANGGWDVTYCLDPKFDVPDIAGPQYDEGGEEEAEGTFGGLRVAVNDTKRPSVSAFFSQWHTRAHVLNGIWTGSIAHVPCRIRMLTGTASDANADVPTIAGYALSGTRPLGSVDLSGLSFSGPLAASTGRIGFQSQIKTLLDDTAMFPAPEYTGATYPYYRMSAEDRAAVEERLRARADAFRQLRGDGGHNDLRLDQLLESMDRASALRAGGSALVSRLKLGVAPTLEVQADIAVDLIAQGVCSAVMLNSTFDWDTHIANNTQHGMYEGLFAGLSHLADALTTNGLFEDTVVAVLSEMTRTPRLNIAYGKDHWAHTSALVFGGPVRGDVTSGATDDLLESLPVQYATGEVDPGGELMKYDNLAAGLLDLVGVDPGDWLPDVKPFSAFKA